MGLGTAAPFPNRAPTDFFNTRKKRTCQWHYLNYAMGKPPKGTIGKKGVYRLRAKVEPYYLHLSAPFGGGEGGYSAALEERAMMRGTSDL